MAEDKQRLEREELRPHKPVAALVVAPVPPETQGRAFPTVPLGRGLGLGRGSALLWPEGQSSGLAQSTVSQSHSSRVGHLGSTVLHAPLPVASLLSPSLSSIVCLSPGGSICDPTVTAGGELVFVHSWCSPHVLPPAPETSRGPAFLPLPVLPPPSLPYPHSLCGKHSFVHSLIQCTGTRNMTHPARWDCQGKRHKGAMMTGSLL